MLRATALRLSHHDRCYSPPFDLLAVARKKLTVDFDGGYPSSDAGLLLLREAERQRGVCRRLGDTIVDRRDQSRIRHEVIEFVAARVLTIACGHEDAIDHDRLRHDPLLKMAFGRAPETGAPPATQSTISRFEYAPTKWEAVQLTAALIDYFVASVKPGAQEILDIDDTVDTVRGNQQMSFLNPHLDERCFLPIHVFHTSSGAPVVAILRTGKTPKGREVATVLKHTTRRLRRHEHWQGTHIVRRGDSHYGRSKAMDWCETNDVGSILGLARNAALERLCEAAADKLRPRNAASDQGKMRAFCSFTYRARSWARERRRATLNATPLLSAIWRAAVVV